jgi:hypothetical protein
VAHTTRMAMVQALACGAAAVATEVLQFDLAE